MDSPFKLPVAQQAQVARTLGDLMIRLNRLDDALRYLRVAQRLETTPAIRKQISGAITEVNARLRRQQVERGTTANPARSAGAGPSGSSAIAGSLRATGESLDGGRNETMRKIIAAVVLLIGVVSMGLGWAAFQAAATPAAPLSGYVPSGALLYLQAKDFSVLLADWNGSPQKQAWLGSSNYEIFSRSRLLLRLNDAGKQFAAAAGLPPDMNFMSQVAGSESALALYDIGKLQFIYVTRLPSANAMQNQLWQTRAKFETRSAGGLTFYLRRDPESQREVEFAVHENYLLLATREDLMASALQLMAGGKDRTIDAEPWFAQSVAAAGPVGDLRMILNLEKIVPSPYFRSYWVQQNISEMKSYSAAVSDLFRSGKNTAKSASC